MSEQTPEQPETIHTYMLGDRSLADWHAWLTTDATTGEDTGHLQAPGSRYGRTSRDCAYWAVAAETVYAHANGVEDDLEGSFEFCMGLVVNDNVEIADMIREYLWVLPDDLKEQLDWGRIEFMEED